jgi:hypothetical protein
MIGKGVLKLLKSDEVKEQGNFGQVTLLLCMFFHFSVTYRAWRILKGDLCSVANNACQQLV